MDSYLIEKAKVSLNLLPVAIHNAILSGADYVQFSGFDKAHMSDYKAQLHSEGMGVQFDLGFVEYPHPVPGSTGKTIALDSFRTQPESLGVKIRRAMRQNCDIVHFKGFEEEAIKPHLQTLLLLGVGVKIDDKPVLFSIDPADEDTAQDDEQRLKRAIELAQSNYWSTIAASFPKITSGDMPPEAVIAFDEACQRATQIWITSNQPEAKRPKP